MNTPSALEGVARQLVQRGLPAGYAAHAMAELVDHFHDLQARLRATGVGEEAASAEALHRLGDSRRLVRKMVGEYQRRHWCGRWPLLSFVLAPIPALGLFWLTMAAGLVGAGWLCQLLGIELTQIDGKTSLFERSLVETMWGVDFLLGPILVMSLFAWLARRSGLSLAWGVVIGLQMALVVGLTQFNVDYERCTLQLGLPVDMPSLTGWIHWYFGGTWRHLVQVVMPLALALAIVAIQIASRRRAVSALAC